jgi:hypothetical protein
MENWIKNIFKTNDKLDWNIIKQAISDYRNEGKDLMFELGKKYDLNISNSEDYEKLVSRTNENIPRRGKLSESWNYVFHGCECGFHNKTGQSIEVVLSNAPEFGHVDAWFLLSYMQSTEKYRSSAHGMDWQELQKVVNKLYENGEVENIE